MASELSWETFQEFFLQPGKPKAIRLKGVVPATLFVTEYGRTMGVRLPAGKGATALRSPMRQLSIAVSGSGPSAVLELSTGARTLFKEFFLFAMDIADAVQRNDIDVSEAVETALRSWRELLQRAARLSLEAEVGLIGELLVLQRLADSMGDTAVGAWIGPLKQRHDFRLAKLEIEVKTTSMQSREHFINSWDQLLPSSGTPLYLLSIQLESAGNAKSFSLPSLIETLMGSFGSTARVALAARLENVGYLPGDAPQYPERFKRRSPDQIILVDAAFPRLVSDLVKLPDQTKRRIKELHYRINVDGLGFPDTSPKFAKLIPGRER